MKVIERKILAFQETEFFSPIRNKIDYVRLLTFSAKQLLLNSEDKNGTSKSKLKLVKDKMSRIFFYRDKKYFSVAFPLNVTISDQNVITRISTYSGRSLNYKSLSAIKAIIDDPSFKTDASFINFFFNQDNGDSDALNLLEELFLYEPAYVRYDCDPERVNGLVHPLHHLDINYSQYGTFKLGLSDEIAHEYFESLHNIRTDCIFLKD